ncbi:MAG TPA: bifunctional oligoribonuclease/PAP phosphatase NrnA [Bacilli bacterium]|nr:bifunctional oligoribonuclease/PAP phosphatase NrnA [Bacilli bacterium]
MPSKIDAIILEEAKAYKREHNRIIKNIIKYDRIAIFRHIMPDFDAMGTQMGLYTWIKDNFPNKEVHFLGDNHVTFTPRLFPETERLNDEWFKEPFLAIIIDTANTSRIADPRWKKAKYKIKIDHHPDVEDFGKTSIVNTSMAAASEVVVNLILSIKGNYVLTKQAASYFYIALAGDSGRFQYNSTTPHTFAIAKELVKTGFLLSDIYKKMYFKKIEDLRVTAYVLNNFSVSEHGVAYYVLSAEVQKELNITTERGKENVNLFSNIDGINVWCSITEDAKDKCYRVSIRSKEKTINQVAAKYEGGGHAQASGAKLKSLDVLPQFIQDLDNLFVE